MAPPSLWVASVLLGLLHFNEASMTGMEMRVKSRQEIMAQMTTESAVRTFMHMNQTVAKQELMALIQVKLGRLLHKKASLRGKRAAADQQSIQTPEDGEEDTDSYAGSSGGETEAVSNLQKNEQPSGYSALDGATNMLNKMGEETQSKLMLEQIRCSEYESSQFSAMDTTQRAVVQANSRAAQARGQVLENQGIISTTDSETKELKGALTAHKAVCKTDIEQLKAQLKVVRADIKVMAKIMELTKCKSNLFLIACAHCQNSVMLQQGQGEVQQMLSNLQSMVAKQYVQTTLKETYDEAMRGRRPVALTQERVTHIIQHRKRHHSRRGPLYAPAGALNTSDAPHPPAHFDCRPTTKCSIASSPNCEKLRDRFLLVQVGIEEKSRTLKSDLASRQSYCMITTQSYKRQLEEKAATMRIARSNLAKGTEDQNTAESESHLKSDQHATMVTEYQSEMKTCCSNQNEMKSEICALNKIRGELLKMEGQKTFITDCAVSDWQAEECSVTCGGGIQVKTRSVIVHPVGKGMKCPPLRLEENCNMQPCPTDCELEDWGGWSSCSAKCGGGVVERTRNIKVDPDNGGDPCESTEEESACNMQSCDADCVLTDWSPWSACSKMCGGGTQKRTKGIEEEARGTGFCAVAGERPTRLNFKPCNMFPCTELIPEGRNTLKCQSLIDFIILLDGSGSLGSHGWAQSKAMAISLINSLEGGSTQVQVSLQLFSGPRTWEDYWSCSDDKEGVDMEKQCGIKWISHYESDTSVLAKAADDMDWPAASTMTAMALAQAEQELVNGRPNANAVVLVITDGRPISQMNTESAAASLQKKARLIWIPVGGNAPKEMIEKLASEPKRENVIEVASFQDLTSSGVINSIVSNSCPNVF